MKRLTHLLAVMLVAAAAVSAPAQAAIQQVSGRLTMLRVHQAGTGYGPAGDHLDADAIVQLKTAPGKAFWFSASREYPRPFPAGDARSAPRRSQPRLASDHRLR
jgi:hypothetical protein